MRILRVFAVIGAVWSNQNFFRVAHTYPRALEVAVFRRFPLVLTVVGLAIGVVGGTASAVVPGLTVTGGFGTFNSNNKTLTTECPTGQQVVSGWGSQSGSVDQTLPQVDVDRIVPNAALTSVTIAGVEGEGGQSSDWAVQTTVWCANQLPGLERVAATSASNSGSAKAVVATCPAAKRVVGVGGEITGGGGQVILDDVVPGAALTKAEAKGVEDQNGFSSSWSVTAYAICANPPAGLERAPLTTSLAISNDKELGLPRVACPGTKTSIAIGSTLNAGIGQARGSR